MRTVHANTVSVVLNKILSEVTPGFTAIFALKIWIKLGNLNAEQCVHEIANFPRNSGNKHTGLREELS